MSHITLIRHGQANSTAKDELSYDRLSPLGHEQAAWLGDHLRQSETHHTRLYTGTLTRRASLPTRPKPMRTLKRGCNRLWLKLPKVKARRWW